MAEDRIGKAINLSIVVPCYNEEESLPKTAQALIDKMKGLIEKGLATGESRITFVNDGSKDNTWQVIRKWHEKSGYIDGISLSRNRGHQNALLAGLLTTYSTSDAVITIDADLQEDINAIDEMIAKFQAGADVVYGVRNKRTADSLFKRFTGEAFYKLFTALGAHYVYNHADYRLMSRRAVEALAKFKEVNLFLRGLVPLIGFKSDVVHYEQFERQYGVSKYPFKRMMAFALDGITSLSIKPMQIIFGAGIACMMVSLFMSAYFLYDYFRGNTVPGWATLVVSIWFLGGMQMASLGIIGYYVGKTYLETKERPRYIIESYLKH